MTTEAKSWPELQEELARKVIDVLNDRVHMATVTGTITSNELRLVSDALYDAVSGLVPWDIANLVYQVREACK